jgi:hypothetical protein
MKKIEKKLSFDKKTITELKNDELKNFYGGEKGSRNCPVKPATMGTKDCIATMAGCETAITQVQSCCQPNINCESAASVTC